MADNRRVIVHEHPDGLVLRNPVEPVPTYRSMVHVLIDRAAEFPDRTLVAEKRKDGGWDHLTYADAVHQARSVAQWLIDNGASIERPLAILSPASIRHFVVAWGAQMARVPYVPVSYSYSTIEGAFEKLDAVLSVVDPAFVYAEDFAVHQLALDSIDWSHDETTIITGATGAAPSGHVDLDAVLAGEDGDDVERSIGAIDHSTVTRYMFTSGSTGMPKGVIHTQGMACHFIAVTETIGSVGANPAETRILDWMPWSHVGAGVMRLNTVVNNASSLYLDTGRPVPGRYQATIDNIRDVKPTAYGGSPLGWSMLTDALEADDDLARCFFENIRSMNVGSAAMPESLARRIAHLTERYKGAPLAMGTSLLSTEVSVGLSRFWPTDYHEVLGLPAPGAEVKLLPLGEGRHEVRVRSLGVTPGYLGDPAKTAASFDDEGFFRLGDAVRFLDEADPDAGLVFAGRVAEDFKLSSGTWVTAGSLRADLVTACSPWVRDVVVCGLNEADIALLVWPNLEACRALDGPAEVERVIAGCLAEHNTTHPGSSQRVARFLMLSEPPDPGAHEIVDKGYVNQRAVQTNRSDEVARLYAEHPDAAVVTV